MFKEYTTLSDLLEKSYNNLTDKPDLTTYALLAGRSGGQTLIGGTTITDVLKLQGTSGIVTLTSPAIQALVGNNGNLVAMTILNNGNVGVGVTAPLSRLHIWNSNSGATPYWSNSGLIIEKSDYPVLQFLSATTGNAYINFGDPAQADIGHIVYKHTKNEGGIDYYDYLQAVVGGQGVFSFASNKVWLTGPVGINPGGSVYATTPAAMMDIRGEGTTSATYSLAIKNSAGTVALTVRDDLNVGLGTVVFGQTSAKVFGVGTGTPPTTSPENMFQMYSADIVAGEAAPHFRTEHGDIIKLYQQAHIPDAVAGTVVALFNTLLGYLENTGLLATA